MQEGKECQCAADVESSATLVELSSARVNNDGVLLPQSVCLMSLRWCHMILSINMSKEGAPLLVSQASLEHSNMFSIGEVDRVLAFTATSHLQRP